MLTIAIPTYNRNELLKSALEKIIPQLGSEHKVLIVDNSSDTPVKETLDDLLDNDLDEKVFIERNSVNVGGSANILRCLELCETKWLYCLSDDDLVASNCLSIIDKNTHEYPDALYFSFSRCKSEKIETVATRDLSGFIDHLDDWSSFLFMSSVVVNASRLRTEIRWGYLYAYSWAPLQAILIRILSKEEGMVVFSRDIICVEESLSADTWVPFPVAAGKMVLPELVDDKKLRYALALRLMSQPSALSLIYWARLKAKNINVLHRHRFYLDLYLKRCLGYARKKVWLRCIFYKSVSYIITRPFLLPDTFFNLMSAFVLHITKRGNNNVWNISDDRT